MHTQHNANPVRNDTRVTAIARLASRSTQGNRIVSRPGSPSLREGRIAGQRGFISNHFLSTHALRPSPSRSEGLLGAILRLPWWTTLSSLALLAGCAAVGPNYKPADLGTPASYSGVSGASPIGTVGGAQLATKDIAQWWTAFNDSTLTALVTRGLAANNDLRLASSSLREARALRGVEAASRLPSVDSRAGVSRSQRSEGGLFTGGPGNNDPTTLWTAGLDASYEIDLFGGVRRAIQAADADVGAALEAERGARVSVAAEIARNYFEYRAFQERLNVIDRSIAAESETLALTEARVKAGMGAQLDLTRAQARLATRKSQRPVLMTAMRAAMFRLGVLTGQAPTALSSQLEAPAPIPNLADATTPINVGLPAELLLRRPDLRAAERRVAAASARVGVATSDLYPKFSLTGSFGFDARSLPDLLDSSSRAWSIGPTMRWNLFDGGRIRRRIDAAGEREKQALIAYEQTLLLSLEEVENALTRLTQEQARRALVQEAASSNERSVELSRARYTSGVGDFFDVLESQQQLFDTQDQLVVSDAAIGEAVVALYKSLGGGWQATP